mgnify:FL=1
MARLCLKCSEEVPDGRIALGYDTCLPCGEVYARKRKHCIVPLNKSNYVVVTDPNTLKQLNPKGTRT